jgi:hypothetical protein
MLEDVVHIGGGLGVGGDTAVLGHGSGAGVVGGQGQRNRPVVLLEVATEKLSGTVDGLGRVDRR